MSRTPQSTRTTHALGTQLAGLLVLSAGLALLHLWIGVSVLGAGLIVLGVAMELG
ncbi:MAG: hypothetical protein ACRENL_01495 [Candidatus Dormibacteria bacterium]